MSALFFKWLYPDCELHAFEPDKDTFRLLKLNIEENNFDNVYLYNVALSDRTGLSEFYIDKQKPGALRMSLKSERMQKDKTMVKTITLSSFIQNNIRDRNIDLLKMDVEGVEDKVIMDLAYNGNLQNVHSMVIEYHHNIGNDLPNLSHLLKILEENSFDYKIDASRLPMYSEKRFQNIMIYAHKI
jgi:FkbM family methyltransferase